MLVWRGVSGDSSVLEVAEIPGVDLRLAVGDAVSSRCWSNNKRCWGLTRTLHTRECLQSKEWSSYIFIRP
jgi:hypothetical protein